MLLDHRWTERRIIPAPVTTARLCRKFLASVALHSHLGMAPPGAVRRPRRAGTVGNSQPTGGTLWDVTSYCRLKASLTRHLAVTAPTNSRIRVRGYARIEIGRTVRSYPSHIGRLAGWRRARFSSARSARVRRVERRLRGGSGSGQPSRDDARWLPIAASTAAPSSPPSGNRRRG